MVDRLISITKHRFFTTIPIPFSEVVFSGTLIFLIYLRKKFVCPFIKSAYIDLIEKMLVVVNFQTKTSGSSVKLIKIFIVKLIDISENASGFSSHL
jgi:hypothetical protein